VTKPTRLTQQRHCPSSKPSRVILGVNLKTAGAMNLTIPLDLLARPDEVIE